MTTIEAANVREGDLITYVGAFDRYRVLTNPVPCPQIPGRIRFEARNETSNSHQKVTIRLEAKRAVTLIENVASPP